MSSVVAVAVRHGELWSRVRPIHGARRIRGRRAAVRFEGDEVRSILGAQLHGSIRGSIGRIGANVYAK